MPKIYNFRLHSLGNCITIGWSCQAKAEGRDGKMVHIVLVEPEIPQNCGNIARTCAAAGCDLHLIRPLGFDISDRAVKRAGLDYWHLVSVYDYENLEDFFRRRPEAAEDLWLATTKAPPGLLPGPVPGGVLAVFRQGDGGPAGGVPPGPL